ncbi:MAG: ABC transporter permease subunit [Clostridia bacterium]|nr:ABC transporter permease subunit [Clostridia bacterium]
MTASTTPTPDKTKKLLKSLGAFVFWMAAWQAAAMIVGKDYVLPSPYVVFKTLLAIGGEGYFWLSALYSLVRIFVGFVFGVTAGTLLAAATLRWEAADAIISPLLRVVRATPVASFIILAILWIGRAQIPGFIAMLMVAPIVWGNITAAAMETDGELLEMAAAYRFGPIKTLKLIYIPSIFPSWRAACLTGIGLAWKAGIAAEVLCLPKTAIGTELYYSKIYFETPELFAWTAVVVILSFILEKSFVRLTGRRGGL